MVLKKANKKTVEDFVSATMHEFRKFILFGKCLVPGEHQSWRLDHGIRKAWEALSAHLSLAARAWSWSSGRRTWTVQPLLISDPALPSQLSGWIIELSWLLAKAGLGVCF